MRLDALIQLFGVLGGKETQALNDLLSVDPDSGKFIGVSAKGRLSYLVNQLSFVWVVAKKRDGKRGEREEEREKRQNESISLNILYH